MKNKDPTDFNLIMEHLHTEKKKKVSEIFFSRARGKLEKSGLENLTYLTFINLSYIENDDLATFLFEK